MSSFVITTATIINQMAACFCIFSAPSDDGLFCVVIHNFWEGAKSFDEDDEY
jgi:hypothetical protein